MQLPRLSWARFISRNDRSAGNGRGAAPHHPEASEGAAFDRGRSQRPDRGGKTTLARALERKGFSYTRFSLVLDDLLAEQGLPRDRFNRQKLGSEINASGRQRWLSARAVAKVQDADRIVIDGLRFPDDHAFMVERFGASFRHVFIDAGTGVRCSRYEDGDGDVTFDEASGAEVERRVGELRSLAHEVLVNQGAKSAVERWADQLASRICTR